MLNELLNIIDSITISFIPILMCSFTVYIFYKYFLKKSCGFLKYFISFNIVIIFGVFFMLQSILNVFQWAVLWKGFTDKNITIPSYIKQICYISNSFFYSIVFLLVIFMVLYFLNHQIIPGSGTITVDRQVKK